MSFEGNRSMPPKHIDKARKDPEKAGNRELLSRAGRRGAEVTNKKRAEKREINEAFDQRSRDKEAQERYDTRVQANEHITPIDSEDIDPGDVLTPSDYK